MTASEPGPRDEREWHQRCMGWLGKLGHDLRNQLAPMRTASQLLLSGRLDASRQVEMLETIDRQIQRIVHMLDDLSEFGRVQSGASSSRHSTLDLAVVIDAALRQCADQIRASGVIFERHVPERALMVEGDQQALIQIVSRLLDNALKATTAPGRVTLTVDVPGDQIELQVCDSGRGLAPEQIDAIFTLPVGPRAANGLGISLLLARSCAQRHGGDLSVKSEGESRGSTFVLRLPLSARQ